MVVLPPRYTRGSHHLAQVSHQNGTPPGGWRLDLSFAIDVYIQNATTVVYLGLTRESYSGFVRSQIMQQPATKGGREEILPLSFNWSSNHTTLFKMTYSSVNPQDFSFLGTISFVQSLSYNCR